MSLEVSLRSLLHILLIAAGAACPLGARAQATGPASQPVVQEGLHQLVSRAKGDHWRLRFEMVDDRAHEGRVEWVGRESVRVGTTEIILSDVAGVERMVSEAGGAWKGAAVGGILLGALAYAFASGMCESNCGRVWKEGLTAGAAGAALGGLVGEALQPTRYRWEPVWPP